MTTSHAPGPWELGEFDEHLGYDCMTSGVRAGPAVLDGRDYGQCTFSEISEKGKARMMADAALIAAAPDLLSALQALHEFTREHSALYRNGISLTNPLYRNVYDAIAKATGQG